MKWPFVSRARFDLLQHNMAEMRALHDADVAYYRTRLDTLTDLLARRETAAPVAEPIEVPQPDLPPAIVLDAMRRISPIKDKTFEANWLYWERNKAFAAQHPDQFALDILQGVTHDRSESD